MIPMNLDGAMKVAIAEAHKGAAFVSPNPKVGCVVLDSQGQLISQGHHKKYGGPHAEVEALKGLTDEQLEGAHVIVTLEPCAHEGKTPACAKKLATLPIKKVTYGLVDPNPLVAGQGAEILRKAGIIAELYQGPLQSDLEEVCEEFLVNHREKRIFVAMKVAQSLDGKVALMNGESQWITGPESRIRVHELRAQYDAVLVGKNTILKDNPSLNIRHPQIEKENRVVILDSSGEVLKKSNDLNVFKLHKKANVIVEQGDLKAVLERLYAQGLKSLMVEGGGETFSRFLAAGLVDRLHVFTAPILMGSGKGWSESLKYEAMTQIRRPRQVRSQVFGLDQYSSFRL